MMAPRECTSVMRVMKPSASRHRNVRCQRWTERRPCDLNDEIVRERIFAAEHIRQGEDDGGDGADTEKADDVSARSIGHPVIDHAAEHRDADDNSGVGGNRERSEGRADQRAHAARWGGGIEQLAEDATHHTLSRQPRAPTARCRCPRNGTAARFARARNGEFRARSQLNCSRPDSRSKPCLMTAGEACSAVARRRSRDDAAAGISAEISRG